MKVEISSAIKPVLKPGQLWKNKESGDVYLAAKYFGSSGVGASIVLINTKRFETGWAGPDGFGYKGEDAFEYIGELVVTP